MGRMCVNWVKIPTAREHGTMKPDAIVWFFFFAMRFFGKREMEMTFLRDAFFASRKKCVPQKMRPAKKCVPQKNASRKKMRPAKMRPAKKCVPQKFCRKEKPTKKKKKQ